MDLGLVLGPIGSLGMDSNPEPNLKAQKNKEPNPNPNPTKPKRNRLIKKKYF